MTHTRTFKAGEGFSEADGFVTPPIGAGDAGAVFWVALQAPSPDELTAVQTAFDLHPMTMEDLEHDEDRPRLRQYGDILSLVFFAVRGPTNGGTDVAFQEINMFVGRRFLVTIASATVPELDEAWSRWHELSTRLPADAGAPLYCVLDTLVDGYFPVIDQIADDVDDVEDQVIESHSPAALPAIFGLKKSMLRFRRVAAAGRDVVNTLMVRDDLFSQGNFIFLQDVYDHIVRITDSVDTYRDLLSNAMETYLSVTSNQLAESSNRLNETMQTLTSWSIIIGCAAFITGVYGMNVDGIPLAHHHHGFMSVAMLLGGATVALLAVFRRKGWV